MPSKAISSRSNEAKDDDDQQDGNFEDGKDIVEEETTSSGGSMDKTGEGQGSYCQPNDRTSRRIVIASGSHDIETKGNRIAR